MDRKFRVNIYWNRVFESICAVGIMLETVYSDRVLLQIDDPVFPDAGRAVFE